MPIKLTQLLDGIADVDDTGDPMVSGLAIDSRQTDPGDAFFAYPGARSDGRHFIQQAIDRGAVAVVYDPQRYTPPVMPVVSVPMPDLQRRVGIVADRFYDNPSNRLFITGVTGTNGKTTCTHLLAQAFEHLGVRCGLIGTLGIGFFGELTPTSFTTPDPVSLHRALHRFVAAGVGHVCMEVSSHALDQGRIAGVAFDAAVFTNLSHDHLDYHRDMAAYGHSKAILFDCPSLQLAVLNDDEPFSGTLKARTTAPKIRTYGMRTGDVTAESVQPSDAGLRVVIRARNRVLNVPTALIGRVNAANLLAVAAALLDVEQDDDSLAAAMQRLSPVPGRMEMFRTPAARPTVVVDYAHTPDALNHALQSVREHCGGRLWCVFGCGGNRDRKKRPLMGSVAETLADVVVLTDDNPRLEKPAAIVAEIRSGMRSSPTVIHNRARAIEWTIAHAEPGDWVLVAGKGHETSQQIGHRQLPLSDRSIVSETLGMAA